MWDLPRGKRQRIATRVPVSGIGLTDSEGNRIMFGGRRGKRTIVRYDAKAKKIETSKNVTHGRWQKMVTPDGKRAYVVTWGGNYHWDALNKLYSFRFSDWPDLKFEALGTLRYQKRSIFGAHNLSTTPDGKLMVFAGKCGRSRKQKAFHGIWAYEFETGRKYLVADITGLLAKTYNRGQFDTRGVYYMNHNTVGKDGWIYLLLGEGNCFCRGLDPASFRPVKQYPEIRLLMVRVTKKAQSVTR